MARSSCRSSSQPSAASICVCSVSILVMSASMSASGSAIFSLTCNAARSLICSQVPQIDLIRDRRGT